MTPPDVVIPSICEKGCGLEDLGGALDLVIPSTCEGGAVQAQSLSLALNPCAAEATRRGARSLS